MEIAQETALETTPGPQADSVTVERRRAFSVNEREGHAQSCPRVQGCATASYQTDATVREISHSPSMFSNQLRS